MAAFSGSRFKEFVKKYGKVALGVHFSVSAASITGLYVAIKNNVDVESLFDKLHLPGFTKEKNPPVESRQDGTLLEGEVGIPDAEMSTTVVMEEKRKNRTAELAASTGGALALAVLCNKALFPVRVPITIALTPPVARFLARRNIIKNRV
ncbi:hypothetical protein SLEP1_g33655 [Rubroshorea leprosula]|uniref:DUF1279 domain-containing protein n=1 Tax=Rubroshorea leprosula TaxID=152421 RepID=A0AAV5KHC4_9ROSI|nr:hypothetical protein SLEP1_g33655 [Rubroshorea leprosula]